MARRRSVVPDEMRFIDRVSSFGSSVTSCSIPAGSIIHAGITNAETIGDCGPPPPRGLVNCKVRLRFGGLIDRFSRVWATRTPRLTHRLTHDRRFPLRPAAGRRREGAHGMMTHGDCEQGVEYGDGDAGRVGSSASGCLSVFTVHLRLSP